MKHAVPAAAMMLAALGGCAAPFPPPAPAQQLLAAYPGPGKAEDVFRADDAACQAGAAQGVVAAPTPPAPRGPGLPRTVAPAAQPAPVPTAAVDDGDPGAPDPATLSPGQLYLRCMVARRNIVQPVAVANPVGYAYYAPYPIYAGYYDDLPWLYGGFFGLGLGFGFGRGYGYRGYGYRGYGYRHGGYRYGGGYGYRDSGFRGGRGFDGGHFGGDRSGGLRQGGFGGGHFGGHGGGRR